MDNKIPDKIKDQHIIVDKSVIGKIVNAASLTEHDSVLEIGSGPGNLTKAIAAHAGQVYAIEKDSGYIMELKKIFGDSLLLYPCHYHVMLAHAYGFRLFACAEVYS